jgi:hypothetical protein
MNELARHFVQQRNQREYQSLVQPKINTGLDHPRELNSMRYRQIVAPAEPTIRERLSTVTLSVRADEWDRLNDIRNSYGPTLVTARRDLSPRFDGYFSVDVLCDSPEEASRMLGDWVNGAGAESSATSKRRDG